MGATFAISNIELENGKAFEEEGRTVMSETGLSAETLVEHIETVARITGTIYRNSIYRILGTEDALLIRHNDGPPDNINWDTVVIRKGFFSERRKFAQRISVLSNKYKIPFDVCLAIGENEEVYPIFVDTIENIEEVSSKTYKDLSSGIWRRKNGILNVLGDDLYDMMEIEGMGQKNSTRIAQYIAERCREKKVVT